MGRVRDETQRSGAEKLVRSEVRFTEEANKALDEIAKENGIGKAQLIRYIVDNRMVDYLGSIKFIDPVQGDDIQRKIMKLMDDITDVKTELRRIGVNYNQEIKNQNQMLKSGVRITDANRYLDIHAIEKLIEKWDATMGKAGGALWRILG